jgi:hypothetical protein
MRTFKKYSLDFIILIVFLSWGIIDLFSLIHKYQFVIDLSYSIIFVILFEFSLKYTEDKESRYKSLVKSIYLFNALLIAPAIIIHYRNLSFGINGLEVVNIVIPIQSLVFLYYHKRNNKTL